MSKIFLFIPPVIAAFLPFLAFNFFDTPQSHGFISAEVLFLVAMVALPQGKLLYKLPFFFVLVLFGIWQGTEDCYAYSITIAILLLISVFLPRKRIPLLSFYGLCVLLVFVVDCENFFNFTFSLHISDVWGLASFYWWGPLLFFIVPLLHTFLVLWFSRNYLCESRVELSHKTVFVLVAASLLLGAGIEKMQTRQSVLDFPVKKLYFYKIFLRHFENVNLLDDNMKQSFPVWDDSKNVVTDFSHPTVMILVESWGVKMGIPFTQELFAPYDSVSKSFVGLKARKAGYTQGAEYEDFGSPENKIVEEPIPAKFKKMGLQTWYVHGYDGDFYDRQNNYAKFGFDSLLFKKDLESYGLAKCQYGFAGVCDSSMVGFLDSLLSDSDPKFIYWTTLDAHTPYEFAEKLEPSFKCSTMKLTDLECIYFTLQENTAKHIAWLASRHPEYRFIIRGDHRPIVSFKERKFVNSFYSRWVSMVVVN